MLNESFHDTSGLHNKLPQKIWDGVLTQQNTL